MCFVGRRRQRLASPALELLRACLLRAAEAARTVPEIISGTLAYMAPEQTGYMNRSVDARSDFYSLGVTLYLMLTGALPFAAADPLEWVHCHIARRPTIHLGIALLCPEPLSGDRYEAPGQERRGPLSDRFRR